MPQTAHSNRQRIPRRLFAAPVLLALLVVLMAGVSVDAQRRGARQQPGKKPANAQTPPKNAANANTAAQTNSRAGRLGSLRSSDTDSGSRVTITSDSALSDYSAYRSGDRYYVKLPKADAKAVKGGLRGKGFEDAQVQQQGDDVVLSIRLQPGASARVNQKFNRLNVEVVAPGGQDATVAGNTARTPATSATTAPRPANDPRNQNRTAANASSAQTANAATNPASSRTSDTGRTAQSDPTLLNPNDAAANNAIDESFNPSVAPATAQTPTTIGTPVVAPSVVEQIAQVQPPQTAAPATANQSTPAAQSGTSFVGVVLQNWPLALVATLLLVGIGLFIVARRSSSSREVSPADAPPAALTETTLPTPKLAAKTAATTAATKTTATTSTAAATAKKQATPLANASATSDASASASSSSSALNVAGGLAAASTGAALQGASGSSSSGVAGDATKSVAGRSKEMVPLAAEFDSERVQAETKKLLDGETYDADVIGVSDIGMRELVAAELLAALASRNTARRERARRAFLKHGYFEDAQRSLQTAEAPAERASAARSLGLVGDRAATSSLVAALDDAAMEVRRASVEALADVRDPSAVEPLEELRAREKDQKRKVPRTLIQRAIDVCAAAPAELPVAPPEIVAATAPPAPTSVEATPPDAAPAPEIIAQASDQQETPTLETPRPEMTGQAATQPAATATEATTLEATTPEVSAPEVSSPEATLEVLTPELTMPEAARDEMPTLVAEASIAGEMEASHVAVEPQSPVSAGASVAGATATPVSSSHDEVAASLAGHEQALAESSPTTDELVAAELETPTLEHDAHVVEEAAPVFFEPLTDAAEPETLQVEAVELFTAEEASIGQPEAFEDETPAHAPIFTDAPTTPPTTAAPPATSDVAVAAEPLLDAQVDEATEVKSIVPVAAASDWIDLDMMEGEEAGHEAAPPVEATAPSVFEPLSFEPTAFEQPPAAPAPPSYTVSPLEPESPLKSLREAASEKRIDIFTSTPAAKPVPPPVAPAAAPPTARSESRVAEDKAVDIYSTVPKGIQQRLASDEPSDRAAAIGDLARLDADEAFRQICAAFDDESSEVRDEAARSLYSLTDDHAEAFTRALRESSVERRRYIGAALASSGLADDAIGQLTGESRDKTYDAFSLLFLMAKAGEVQPLIRAVESHGDNEVRLAVVKLLALSGQQEILPHFRRLAVRGSLPTEVRSAVMEAIYQISSNQPAPDTSRVG